MQTVARNDDLWQQYSLWVDLYKFHVDAAIKANAFHYAITGAILSFVLSSPDHEAIRWGLALPFLLSTGLAVIMGVGSKRMGVPTEDVKKLSKSLGLDAFPDFSMLTWFLALSAVTHAVTALGLLVLFCALGT